MGGAGVIPIFEREAWLAKNKIKQVMGQLVGCQKKRLEPDSEQLLGDAGVESSGLCFTSKLGGATTRASRFIFRSFQAWDDGTKVRHGL